MNTLSQYGQNTIKEIKEIIKNNPREPDTKHLGKPIEKGDHILNTEQLKQIKKTIHIITKGKATDIEDILGSIDII